VWATIELALWLIRQQSELSVSEWHIAVKSTVSFREALFFRTNAAQAIADALYGALGQLAASQGTMNNFSFGNGRYQYYETICGGSGAGPGFAGTDAVQTHMTNSRLTDIEVRTPGVKEMGELRERLLREELEAEALPDDG
jgi:hypothetical protein